jgi:hypothetical protein
VDLGWIDREQRRESCDDLVPPAVRQVGRADLHREGRHVGHERATVAVVDEPTGGRDGLQDGALSGRDRAVLGPVRDLQVEQSGGQCPDCEHDDDPEHEEPREAPLGDL